MSIYPRGTDPHEPLEAVLRAVAVPGHPEELAGEQAAVAAFRTAAVAAPRKRSFLARMLTVKVLVVGGVAVSTGVVLAAVGGALPIPGIEPGNTPPADPPSVTNPAVVPVETPRDDPTSSPDEPAGQEPERQTDEPRQPPHPTDEDFEPDRPGDDDPPGPGSGKKKDDKHGQPDPNDPAPDGSSGRPQTPDSPAQGAVTAVPPNGAEPPSPGD